MNPKRKYSNLIIHSSNFPLPTHIPRVTQVLAYHKHHIHRTDPDTLLKLIIMCKILPSSTLTIPVVLSLAYDFVLTKCTRMLLTLKQATGIVYILMNREIIEPGKSWIRNSFKLIETNLDRHVAATHRIFSSKIQPTNAATSK